MKLEKKIELCDTLTPVEQQIASYILKNPDLVMDMKIQELAERLYVSKSAIHRCVKKIGLKGFNELKVCIAKERNALYHENSDIDVNTPFSQKDNPMAIASKLLDLYEMTIKETFECLELKQLEIVAKILNEAKIVDIYTHAHNLNVAENFQDKMFTIGKKVVCPHDFYNQRLNVLASDHTHVAIILSYSGKASWILPILKKLNEKGVKVIQIGKVGSNYYPQYVNYFIDVSDNEHVRNRLSQFSSHISMQYIMDVLYGSIYNIDRIHNSKYIYESIDYMDDRHF